MKNTNLEQELLKTVKSGVGSIDKLIQELRNQEKQKSRGDSYVKFEPDKTAEHRDR